MSLRGTSLSVEINENLVLDDVSFELQSGTVIGLIGPNGAGKSTLLNVACGDLAPASGSIQIDGTAIEDLSAQTLAKVRTVMSQASAIVFDFVVDEIIRMGWVQEDMYLHDVAERALEEVTTQCDISDLRGRRYRTLSGGEQRRVQFARAMLQIWRDGPTNEHRYLLLDEPTANLDIGHELAVLRLARESAEQGVGVLVVLHDLNLAARFTDKLILLNQGRIVAAGQTNDVLEANRLTDVYKTPILVEQHSVLNRLVVHS